ncbi:NlpC/P60 family protein [Streptomyces sp. NPDC100445]|uniref:C40 family peptidase n=1 Tax=Streptomyces sp. NPDC100445 TaxID=3366102 RepID=UPI0037FBD7F5
MAPESRDEVRRRIESLYDQAENATGNFNATRAMAAQRRSRGVPLAKRTGRRAEPVLDTMARQWFDAARAKFGPTVPAVLPPDRRTAPVPFPGRDEGGDPAGGTREALPPGPSARAPLALEGGTGGASGALGELPPGTTGALPGIGQVTGEAVSARAAEWAPERPMAIPEAGRAALTGTAAPRLASDSLASVTADPAGRGMPEPVVAGGSASSPGLGERVSTGVGVAEPTLLPAAVPPTARANRVLAPRALPGAAPGRPSPTVAKGDSRRELTAARDLLARYTGRPTSPAAPAQHPLPWTASPLTGVPATATAAPVMTQSAETLFTITPSAPDTGGHPVVAPPVTTPPGSVTDTGAYADLATPTTPTTSVISVTDTGSYSHPTAPASTAVTDTGSFSHPAAAATPVTDTGSFSYPTGSPLPPSVAAVAAPLPPLSPLPAADSRALRAAKAIAFARAQVGRPCVWGATGPGSYDCSSLVQAAWRAAGVTLPRAAHEQALAGAPVTPADAEPGDLVLFFDDDRHVGLYVGDGMMVHAPGPGSTIREESVYGAGEAAIRRVVRPA